jgi:hypothetical protein
MLVHLGKHRLGQHDRARTTVEHTGELKVIVEYIDGDGDPDPAGNADEITSRNPAAPYPPELGRLFRQRSAPADSGDMSFSSVGAWNGDAASRDNEPFPAPS